MRTNVRESSIEVYHGHVVGSIKDRQMDIIERAVKQFGSCTRRMISRSTGIETSTVSARTNYLVEEGVLIECAEHERMPCPITGKNVYWLSHRDSKPGQIKLI